MKFVRVGLAFLAAYPYLVLLSLWVLSLRGTYLLGRMPVALRDDPRGVFERGGRDAFYLLGDCTQDLLWPAWWGLVVPVVFLLTLPLSFRLFRFRLIAVTLLGWVVLLLDPLERALWLVD